MDMLFRMGMINLTHRLDEVYVLNKYEKENFMSC